MSQPYFTYPLLTTPTGDTATRSGLPRYRLDTGFDLVLDAAFRVTVPTGYVTDFASIPWPAPPSRWRTSVRPSAKRSTASTSRRTPSATISTSSCSRTASSASC